MVHSNWVGGDADVTRPCVIVTVDSGAVFTLRRVVGTDKRRTGVAGSEMVLTRSFTAESTETGVITTGTRFTDVALDEVRSRMIRLTL